MRTVALPFLCRGPAWLDDVDSNTECVDNSTLTMGCTPCPAGWTGDFVFLHMPNCSVMSSDTVR